MPQDISKTTIVLVGPGRAGRAFARSWTRAGGSIVLVARNAPLAREFARELRTAEVLALDGRLRLAGDVLALSVPDDAIASLAARLAGRVACRFGFHFSGALASGELQPLSSSGARLASVHPLRAFSGSVDDDWSDAFVAVEGEESATRTAMRICRQIGARPRVLAAVKKPLYHAAATLAAGGSGSLLSFATRLWTAADLSEEEGRAALAALAAGAVDAVGRLPFDQALTGPVARRDVETVRLHGRALAQFPEVRELYAALARETLRRTAGRGREEEIASIVGTDEERSGGSTPETAEQSDTRGRSR